MIRRLFIDIETSPCIGSFWRPGYNINLSHQNIEVQARIITAAYKWQHEKGVHACQWSKPAKGIPFSQDDKYVVQEIVNAMNQADEIVAHYGDGFDVPWIRTRALYHGIITGVWKTVDTKAWASKNFLLPSNKLDAIAKYLMIGTKIRTEYDLWRNITFADCQKSLAKMMKYNMHDVELLEQVWDRMRHWVPTSTHSGVYNGLPKYTCPECGRIPNKRQRPMVSTTGTVKHQMYCNVCPRYYTVNNAAYQKWYDEN
jgi:hypothetical protein